MNNLNLSGSSDTNRVNPKESRYLRTAAYAMHRPGSCFRSTIRMVVVAAGVMSGVDLTQEERALLNELEMTGAPELRAGHMEVSR